MSWWVLFACAWLAPGCDGAGATPATATAAAAAKPQATLEISGQVVGASGPVPGATVTAARSEVAGRMPEARCEPEPMNSRSLSCGCGEAAALAEMVSLRSGQVEPAATATTDAEGRFALRGLEPGAYTLWADSPAGLGLKKDVAAGTSGLAVTVAAGVNVHGQVIDGKGSGVPGVPVTAVLANPRRFINATSGVDGAFSFPPLPRGRYVVVATPKALLPDFSVVSEVDREPGPLALELCEPRRVRGRVFENEKPAAGVVVTIDGEQRSQASATTGPDGRFELRDVRPGQYQVVARRELLQATARARVTRQEDSEEITLQLQRGGAVTGTVKTRDGAPVPGAQVRLFGTRGMGPVFTAAADGSFRVEPVEPGPAFVVALAEGFLPVRERPRVEVVAGGTVTVDPVVGERAVPVEGRVLDPGGEPLAQAQVFSTGAMATTTDQSGRFTLHVAPGPVTITAGHPGYAGGGATATAPATGVTIRLSPQEVVNGVVLATDGTPVRGADVTAERGAPGNRPAGPSGGRYNVTRSDKAGAFQLRLLRGTYTLYAARGDVVLGKTPGKVIQVPTSGRVELILPAGQRIAGVVVDRAGKPIATKVAAMKGNPVLGWAGGETSTDPRTGAFELKDLEPGAYEVWASPTGYAYVKTMARTGDRKVKLVLTRIPMVSGRVVTPDREPVTSFMLNGKDVSDAEGRFALPREKRRELAVSISVPAQYAPTNRRAPPGATDLDLGDIVLDPGRRVTGRVVDDDTGAGVPGVEVRLENARNWDEGYTIEERMAVLRTDAQGGFALPHVEDRAGPLIVTHQELGTTHVKLAGQTTLEIRLRRLAKITGEVRLQGGAPPKTVQAHSTTLDTFASAPPDPSGQFTLTGLTPGSYYVAARGAGVFLPQLVSVPAHGEARVTLEEQTSGASLRVTLEPPGGVLLLPGALKTPRTAPELSAFLAAGMIPKGTGMDEHTFQLLPPGTYTLLTYRQSIGEARYRSHAQQVTISGPGKEHRVKAFLPASAKWINLYP